MKEGDIELLRKIARFEASHHAEKALRHGWSWEHVREWPATLSRLFRDGYLEIVSRTNSYRGYCLSELGKAVVAEKQSTGEAAESTADYQPTFSDDLFDDITGHDEVKELLKACLTAERPVHVLLTGPPALAKTLFLWDIERAAGEAAIWLVGSATSKACLWDVVAERQPRIILIDELDKMNAADTAALLSVMEGGRLVRAKKGRRLDLSRPLRVVAASNRHHSLSPELRSRFAVRELKPYGRSDYLAVVRGVLVRREGLDDETAGEIARKLDGLSQDVRDAVRVARLAPQLGVEQAVRLLLGG